MQLFKKKIVVYFVAIAGARLIEGMHRSRSVASCEAFNNDVVYASRIGISVSSHADMYVIIGSVSHNRLFVRLSVYLPYSHFQRSDSGRRISRH
jgi:hypothetical protein